MSSNYNPPQKQTVLCRESRRQRLGGSAQVTHRQASSSDCEGRRGLAAEMLRLQRSKGLFAVLSSRIPLPGLHREAAGIFALRYLGIPLGLVVGAWRGAAVGCLERCQVGCNPPTPSSLAFPDPPRLAAIHDVCIGLSPSAASSGPQPGLFLADLFIWVLHCFRPRLSFCCTCASVHSPGSFRHRGGVSFYPRSPSGIDNCLAEGEGEDGAMGGVPVWCEGMHQGGRKKTLDRQYMNNKLRCFKFLFL